ITNDEGAAELPNQAATSFGLEATFKAQPGTLPRLRFGGRYRLRARAVDLAGNSLPPGGDATATDSPVNTDEIVYTRFEPVVAPIVVALEPPKEGESIERVVIRGEAASPATGSAERLLAPPKGGQSLAEKHGMFDTPQGWRTGAYELIVNHEGSFSDDPAQVHPEA